ncbi:MAG: hypothetical protein HZA66_02280 [Rhodopseudomonas palustris]|uniref:Sulfur globule protein n=1 Tax=Rhodopseudomonas palustris TaxID=1076 RepID=A0A933RU01_RHOPL|nr:hypothetical protein [Rhodopseudomonas palustris]
MFGKAIVAFSIGALVALAAPTAASARGGFHGGGWHGGGWHGGGWHGGGWHGGWRGPGFGIGAVGVGLGLGLAAPYAWGGYGPAYYNGYGYSYPAAVGYDDGCYLRTQRVWTPYGWRLRRVEVCY